MSGLPREIREVAFSDYFARTRELPAKERTTAFLSTLPENARLLDFGCGTGRWAAAFMRDRPDLTIDLMDQELDQALSHGVIPESWRGEKTQKDFRLYEPKWQYDGIWAYAALFFLPRHEMERVFGTLAGALKPGGVIEFTMPNKHMAELHKLSGMTQTEIAAMLEKSGLKPLSIIYDVDERYGGDHKPLPTFHVRAQKVN